MEVDLLDVFRLDVFADPSGTVYNNTELLEIITNCSKSL